jgi:hypothetical protein
MGATVYKKPKAPCLGLKRASEPAEQSSSIARQPEGREDPGEERGDGAITSGCARGSVSFAAGSDRENPV